ncbi:alanine racemase [Lacticaseibacillus sharpeae]|uniref:Alanine racemase n=1 Tax=Lacticaseibacillus sharpeae JCM 1186 = DSM 20505 TaxID=1291052 RepID=A0A0R1ZVU1_9LACO|nr:alanine racemase [Lacticaseibacillus sharpeae]KRM56203.1 alanine racemase [Lacticaseibacillus sharpeae JCM 1186 = DSM 20505]
MVVALHRPTKAIVRRSAIKHNVAAACAQLKAGTELFAVVKANAYGHGLVEVAKLTRAAGATGLCVAVLDEALELRRAGITGPILVLGIVDPEAVQLAADNDIAVPVAENSWLHAASQNLTGTKPLRVHLATDTGMGRIGFTDTAELQQAAAFMQDEPAKFTLAGIFTHFATADEVDDTQFKAQCARFNEFVAALPQRPRYVHVANTATSLWHDACHGNMVRFGVGIYGLNPSGRTIAHTPYALEPAMRIESALVMCKHVPAGTTVSYGATYVSAEDEFIGTVPMGYADGWLRRMQGATVLVDGHRCPIVGRVCMDQFMIRLPHAYPRGTKVTLVGRDGDDEITLQDVADFAGTIHYEIACCLSERVPRVYVD